MSPDEYGLPMKKIMHSVKMAGIKVLEENKWKTLIEAFSISYGPDIFPNPDFKFIRKGSGAIL